MHKKIINPNTDDTKYMINIRQMAKFVVGLGDKVAPTDIDEGMRVGVDRTKYAIQIPLPPKIDPTVSLMEVEDKPDVTYDDVGGSKKALEQLREVVEIPLLHPERFVTLGIDPPKGVLLYGPPGTGKTHFPPELLPIGRMQPSFASSAASWFSATLAKEREW